MSIGVVFILSFSKFITLNLSSYSILVKTFWVKFEADRITFRGGSHGQSLLCTNVGLRDDESKFQTKHRLESNRLDNKTRAIILVMEGAEDEQESSFPNSNSHRSYVFNFRQDRGTVWHWTWTSSSIKEADCSTVAEGTLICLAMSLLSLLMTVSAYSLTVISLWSIT